MRVTDRPRLALDVLLGLQPSYLKVVVPSAHREAAWQQVLLEHLLLPLYVTGPGGSTRLCHRHRGSCGRTARLPAPVRSAVSGRPGRSLTHDVYLLRDVVAPPGEPLAAALASDEERSAVLDETHEG